MKTHPMLSEVQLSPFRNRFGNKKIFAQSLMPVRGSEGFRQLDYDFAQKLDPSAIISKIIDHGFNALGLVVKDTDGAILADPRIGWNPTGRDLLQEFAELCQSRNIVLFLSVTNMNDAYRAYTHPETVSIHIRNGRNHRRGDIGIHNEGEMRVYLPEGISLEEMQRKIPFLTDKFLYKKGAPKESQYKGYIPLTGFHCPRSEHVDYMLKIVKELASKYPIDGILADYIRYHHGYSDFCGCQRCRTAFVTQFPKANPTKLHGKAWDRFRMNTIIEFGKKFTETIKSVNDQILTGWFSLSGPRIYSEKMIAQDFSGLTRVMDCALPMLYPYLSGTLDDGWKWRKLGDFVFWDQNRTIRRRFSDYGHDKSIFTITNSVDCNVEEMLKSMQAFDFGLGIALFKYYGTKESQWYACKLYSDELRKQTIGMKPPSLDKIKDIMRKVFAQYPPKCAPKWWKQEQNRK